MHMAAWAMHASKHNECSRLCCLYMADSGPSTSVSQSAGKILANQTVLIWHDAQSSCSHATCGLKLLLCIMDNPGIGQGLLPSRPVMRKCVPATLALPCI